MSPQRLAILLVIGGLMLATNPAWLFPHEGDTRYTYRRSEIRVENGTFEYAGEEIHGFAEQNSLNPVGCQPNDDEHPRACAFDHHLLTHESVTVPGQPSSLEPDFVRLNGTYYRRLHHINGSDGTYTGTYDVKRVTPETILTESALELSRQSGSVSDALLLRVAATGDSVTTFEDLDEEELGTVYRINGSYYTVVGTNERIIDHGLTFLRYELPRYLLVGVGVLLVVGALFVHRES